MTRTHDLAARGDGWSCPRMAVAYYRGLHQLIGPKDIRWRLGGILYILQLAGASQGEEPDEHF